MTISIRVSEEFDYQTQILRKQKHNYGRQTPNELRIDAAGGDKDGGRPKAPPHLSELNEAARQGSLVSVALEIEERSIVVIQPAP